MLRLNSNQPEASKIPSVELQELFIEELTEVHGGSLEGPLDKVRDLLLTTYGCCEEGPASCC
jgi:hypothetical protein